MLHFYVNRRFSVLETSPKPDKSTPELLIMFPSDAFSRLCPGFLRNLFFLKKKKIFKRKLRKQLTSQPLALHVPTTSYPSGWPPEQLCLVKVQLSGDSPNEVFPFRQIAVCVNTFFGSLWLMMLAEEANYSDSLCSLPRAVTFGQAIACRTEPSSSSSSWKVTLSGQVFTFKAQILKCKASHLPKPTDGWDDLLKLTAHTRFLGLSTAASLNDVFLYRMPSRRPRPQDSLSSYL